MLGQSARTYRGTLYLFRGGGLSSPRKTPVSPRSSPLGTFRTDERNVPSGEEPGETDVFAG